MKTGFPSSATDRAHIIRDRLPPGGLFANQEWRIAPDAFRLPAAIAKELETLGRVLLQFYRAANLLYRQSAAGKEPAWVAAWLDQGKPQELIELQRAPGIKNEWPRVIRPDLLLLDSGLAVTELDSVPGGIGLTGWLNQTYAAAGGSAEGPHTDGNTSAIMGGPQGMIEGFASIFGQAPQVHLVVSKESATYRPEMEWLAEQIGPRFQVRSPEFEEVADGDAVYRFFELFDLPNLPQAKRLLARAAEGKVRLTPPPKTYLEEKMLLALLWNRNLRGFWRRELGEKFLDRLQRIVPYTWLVDPSPMPPHAAIPELGLTDWQQLKTLSQRERDLILKVSGFAETAWGARGVYLGSDLSLADWAAAVDLAVREFQRSPFVLQRYHKPAVVDASWFDFEQGTIVPMKGRVRLCPYYFVAGEGDAARAELGGVLATICPAEKKIIHGMKEAILAPCRYERV